MTSKNANNRLVRESYSDNQAETVFQENRLAGFDQLWSLDAPWFEAPNERRAGISGVVTWDLVGPGGQSWPVFIKRQHNHNTRTFKHPRKGVPTFYREHRNITYLNKLGVPTIEVLYYGEQASTDGTKAILVSRALDGYVSLEDWFNSPVEKDEGVVASVLKQVVAAIKPMHQHRIRHGCLYGKHIFLKFPSDNEIATEGKPVVDVRLLDLEKAHFSLFKNRIITKDLSQLLRHSGIALRNQAGHLALLYFGAGNHQYWLTRLEKQMQGKSKSKG